MTMFGVINVNKPAAMTSRAVVDRVERLVRPAKAGHAGTLDPLATGVLVICVGQATRLIQYVQRMPKCYHATFRLGVRSPTHDVESEIEPVERATEPDRAALDRVLPRFVGEIRQRPPAHSAIKLAGRRAYQLARQGIDLELEPRLVVIHAIDVCRFEYPELELMVKCGSGTYIRSLGRDLGEALGTGAVMTALERTAIGRFRIDDSIDVNRLTLDNLRGHLQPAITALPDLPRLTLSEARILEIRNGRPVMKDWLTPSAVAAAGVTEVSPPYHGESPVVTRPLPAEEGSERGPANSTATSREFAAVDPRGQLVAVLFEKRPGELWPRFNFTESLER